MRRIGCAVALLLTLALGGCSRGGPAPYMDGTRLVYELTVGGSRTSLAYRFWRHGSGYQADLERSDEGRKVKAPVRLRCDRDGKVRGGYLCLPLLAAPIWVSPGLLAAHDRVWVNPSGLEAERFRYSGETNVLGRAAWVYRRKLPGGGCEAYLDKQTGFLLRARMHDAATTARCTLVQTNVPQLQEAHRELPSSARATTAPAGATHPSSSHRRIR